LTKLISCFLDLIKFEYCKIKNKEKFMSDLRSSIDPGQPGPLTFQTVVYGAPNLDYQTNLDLQEYLLFQNPTPGFTTRRIDLSGIADLGFGVDWPFNSTQIPINGIICIPTGREGPFPLVLFAHGNHSPLENSTPGYLYLCELLASQGIIAATIDANFLNGGNFGENDGRAILQLEHVRQFFLWNLQQRHPLRRKINFSRVMIVGHSRGGEAVGHASLFKPLNSIQLDPMSPPVALDGSRGLGPYSFFDLRAAVAIAPTDGQYTPIAGPTKLRDNYLIIHGSRDGDVFTFEGYKTYDRSHAVDLANPTQIAQGFKSLLWIHGANHNFFNSVWQQESQNTITRQQQEQIAKVYIGAIAQAVLLRKDEYLDLLKDYTVGKEWLPDTVKLVSQYQDKKRLFIQHFEEAGPNIVVSSPVVGTVDISNIDAQKLSFDGNDPTQQLFQETQGLRLKWQAAGKHYRVQVDLTNVNIEPFNFLAFRVGQSADPENPEFLNQDFTIKISDNQNTVSFPASSINQLIYPDKVPGFGSFLARMVMQTFRIPFRVLRERGLRIRELRTIELAFDLNSSGVLYLDELQFSKSFLTEFH
jgi:Chlorophyllase enzyme